MPDRFVPINSGSSEEAKWAQVNRNFAQLDAESSRKVFKGPTGRDAFINGQLPNQYGSGFIMNDLNENPVIYGAVQPDGTPVLKVAKTGKNAITGADSDLVFSSDRNTFKIVAEGDMTIPVLAPAPGSSQQFVGYYAHNKGYAPIALAFVESSFNSREQLPIYVQGFNSGTNQFYTVTQIRLTTTPTDLQINVIASSNTFSDDYKFHWYILEESAE